MSTETKTETKPKLDDGTMNQWPPKVHLVEKKNYPPKEGDIALCGAKLMGLALDGMANKNVCKKCREISDSRMGI